MVCLKVKKSLVFALIPFFIFLVLGSLLVGPGMSDYVENIAGEYSYSDAGAYEKTIVYVGNEFPRKIVIDARVDKYTVIGDQIFVARRPRLVSQENGIVTSKLSQECEYWVISTGTHEIDRLDGYPDLSCY